MLLPCEEALPYKVIVGLAQSITVKSGTTSAVGTAMSSVTVKLTVLLQLVEGSVTVSE
jgi:hypothetical protein